MPNNQNYKILLPPFEIAQGEGDNRKVTRIGADQVGSLLELDSEAPATKSLVELGAITLSQPLQIAEVEPTPSPTGREAQLRLIYRQQGYKGIQAIAEPLGIKKPEKGWEDAIPLIVTAEEVIQQ